MRSLWNDPHYVKNPNYPYARGYPLIEPPDRTARFHPDQTVVPKEWWAKAFGHGVTKCLVLNVRRIKYHRRDSWYTQILVINGEGKYHWSHENHFTLLM